ncbi:glucose-1-phosphate cytidylyltransferase [Candidatus Saganbacteria bacterium CG08_land_8_20_14_0_20_45_16]|uniref:Glucose-1-phosphate cytidylyltransferase n=1 Tax=Candidatus Saganbacteria bacterium CG08_land_8_20_14_0_20_45_16 TaxID=2014293 RepID=A0A2H0XTQ9_UNCSA|nr:MAG: glucose-1-phosphate cytidylyltransferase [Candidatus Saganbacteria bacterium CG08_land_8_20_14_0_20_45_16]
MKVVILAGGLGTRISEESVVKPKPMIEIGERPMLWHIMKIYAYYGFKDFIICLGYKGYQIKEYFANYFLHESDVTFNFDGQETKIVHSHKAEHWQVTLVDTGLETSTGGRLKRVGKYLDQETFLFTYGDGVGDINIRESFDFHRAHGKLATVTAVRPLGRFGALRISKENGVERFQEKTEGNNSWINGGFFVLEPKVLDYIDGDAISMEGEPVKRLAKEGNLMAYKHNGFWQPMDTLREKNMLEELWKSGQAPWQVWP